METHPTEMSQAENDYVLQQLKSTQPDFIDQMETHPIEMSQQVKVMSQPDFIDQMEIEIHPTEMSQGENDYEDVLQHLTSTIARKIGEGVQKTESFFSSAEMSQGENDYDQKDLQQICTVAGKIYEGAQKAKSSACIYRVPEDLRKLNETAYTPRLIAIGPLHREDEHLQTPLQQVKLSYTNYLLSRLAVGKDNRESAVQTVLTVLQKCLAEMKTSIDNAKKCYAEEVTLDEEMMLIDGCFILEFLYRCHSKEAPKGDPIFCNSLTFSKVLIDLVLLENQIPLFVLEKLFHLIVDQIPNCLDKNWSLPDYVGWCYMMERKIPLPNSDNSRCSPRHCVLRIFGDKWVNSTTKEGKKGEEDRNANYSHITHILHKLHDGRLPRYAPQPSPSMHPFEIIKTSLCRAKIKIKKLLGLLPHDLTEHKKFNYREMPSALELVYAGVKFVPDPRNEDLFEFTGNDLFKFKFTGNDLFSFKFTKPKGLFWWCRRARFEIPPLEIYDSTESYLRNLIALEQCSPGISRHVSSYAHVMDALVNTDKDIQALEEAGVLRNCLGATQDATHLFNNLCKEIVEGKYFLDTCHEASEYSKFFWPKNMAHVRRTYFDSPWTFIAFCVGFIVFIMTVLQFVHDFFN